MLKHKHIVKYVMFFEDSTSCYILMELCNNKVTCTAGHACGQRALAHCSHVFFFFYSCHIRAWRT